MHRPGSQPDAMSPEDFLCDFCAQHWREDLPMVEGHRGSLICAECLTAACLEVLCRAGGVRVPEPVHCTLCLMHKDEPHWHAAPGGVAAYACAECIRSAARMLERDREAGWKRPTEPGKTGH